MLIPKEQVSNSEEIISEALDFPASDWLDCNYPEVSWETWNIIISANRFLNSLSSVSLTSMLAWATTGVYR